ncbi:hypothetical protein HWV62_43908 [Athelia sp. TMB]|nr:hypothetical protein HWV62_43908 [Athelia sp. TMB]
MAFFITTPLTVTAAPPATAANRILGAHDVLRSADHPPRAIRNLSRAGAEPAPPSPPHRRCQRALRARAAPPESHAARAHHHLPAPRVRRGPVARVPVKYILYPNRALAHTSARALYEELRVRLADTMDMDETIVSVKRGLDEMRGQ